MIDPARDADGDVIDLIEAGRDPWGRPPRPGGLIRLLVLIETAALAASIAVALHYRTEADEPNKPQPTSASAPPMPEVTTVALPLPPDGRVKGTVVLTAAALPGATRGQFTVSAVITGAPPGTYYDLIGNDCSTAAARPDLLWATGLTRADGTADLVGFPWTGAVGDWYWLVLDPSPPATHQPGLHGQFAEGRATPYPAGQPPCPTKR